MAGTRSTVFPQQSPDSVQAGKRYLSPKITQVDVDQPAIQDLPCLPKIGTGGAGVGGIEHQPQIVAVGKRSQAVQWTERVMSLGFGMDGLVFNRQPQSAIC
jgi:hypothetical protein